MSSVPTTVDVERGSPLQGVELTREQKVQLYRDGFVSRRHRLQLFVPVDGALPSSRSTVHGALLAAFPAVQPCTPSER